MLELLLRNAFEAGTVIISSGMEYHIKNPDAWRYLTFGAILLSAAAFHKMLGMFFGNLFGIFFGNLFWICLGKYFFFENICFGKCFFWGLFFLIVLVIVFWGINFLGNYIVSQELQRNFEIIYIDLSGDFLRISWEFHRNFQRAS